MIINTLRHTADDLNLIHGLYTHAKIFLDELTVYNRACNSHGDSTDLQVRFSTHGCCSDRCTSKTKKLLLDILRNLLGICLLNILTVNTKCRKTLLRMSCQYSGKIYCTWSLCTIKAPYCFDGIFIHIHRLRSITPARSNGQCNINTFSAELVRTGSRLCYTSDGCICDHNLYRLSIGVTQVLLKKLCGIFSHAHGLSLQ